MRLEVEVNLENIKGAGLKELKGSKSRGEGTFRGVKGVLWV